MAVLHSTTIANVFLDGVGRVALVLCFNYVLVSVVMWSACRRLMGGTAFRILCIL